MAQVRITQASSDDIEVAVRLLQRFFGEEGFATPADALRRNVTGFHSDPGCAVLLASVDGQPVAVTTVSCTRSTEDGYVAEIQDLYVEPGSRGHGLATALVDAAGEWARQRGCQLLEVVVTPEAEDAHGLSGFYARLGFAGTGRTIHSRRLIG